ncbi:hypothetical protein ElyMa_004098100 [Elysia marginata]|uniref:Uncharacterized protein n=1 Tax=Elysia marginata TaxID=1093978 RepID=A0AAV4GAG0_9GAST|nr:hypothetical protein ElyMa_004098100 [Elysia marginata]
MIKLQRVGLDLQTCSVLMHSPLFIKLIGPVGQSLEQIIETHLSDRRHTVCKQHTTVLTHFSSNLGLAGQSLEQIVERHPSVTRLDYALAVLIHSQRTTVLTHFSSNLGLAGQSLEQIIQRHTRVTEGTLSATMC